MIFFFCFPVSSGKFGKQSLRFRAAKTFFFGITIFLYQNKNPVAHLSHWRQFCASLNSSYRQRERERGEGGSRSVGGTEEGSGFSEKAENKVSGGGGNRTNAQAGVMPCDACAP